MKVFFLIIAVSFCIIARSQNNGQNVGINTTTPDASAILDIKSSNKGVLLPRMLQSERDLISNPAPGLMIWQTDNTPGLYYNSGTPVAPLWKILGPAPVNHYAHFYSIFGGSYPAGSPITLDYNGLNTGCVSHNQLSSVMTINISGTYKIEFTVSTNQPAQIDITVNFVAVESSRFGSSAGQNSGFVITNLTAGDQVRLTTAGSPTLVGVTDPSNGSLTAVKAAVMFTKL